MSDICLLTPSLFVSAFADCVGGIDRIEQAVQVCAAEYYPFVGIFTFELTE